MAQGRLAQLLQALGAGQNGNAQGFPMAQSRSGGIRMPPSGTAGFAPSIVEGDRPPIWNPQQGPFMPQRIPRMPAPAPPRPDFSSVEEQVRRAEAGGSLPLPGLPGPGIPENVKIPMLPAPVPPQRLPMPMPMPTPGPFPGPGIPENGRIPMMGEPPSAFEEPLTQRLNFTQPGGQLGRLLGAQATQQVMEDLPGSIEQRTAELGLRQVKEKRAEAEKMRKQLQTLGRK